jgi:hypothetical protein
LNFAAGEQTKMRYYQKLLFVIVFSAIPILAGAQKQTVIDTTFDRTLSLKAAYMGSIVYPGVKIALEWPTAAHVVTKSKRHGEKSYRKEKYITVSMGMYYHEGFHTNVFLLAERQWRKIRPSGWFTEYAPGMGISRTFLGGTTYRVSNGGIVSKKTLAGYTYAMGSVSSSLGYDFQKLWGKPVRVYSRISVLIMAPYNSYIYLRPTLEIGIITKTSLFNKKHNTSHE